MTDRVRLMHFLLLCIWKQPYINSTAGDAKLWNTKNCQFDLLNVLLCTARFGVWLVIIRQYCHVLALYCIYFRMVYLWWRDHSETNRGILLSNWTSRIAIVQVEPGTLRDYTTQSPHSLKMLDSLMLKCHFLHTTANGPLYVMIGLYKRKSALSKITFKLTEIS